MPLLKIEEHSVKASRLAAGLLFEIGAITLEEQREEQRRTVPERCERVSALLRHKEPAIAWCHLNEEADLLEHLIDDATQVSGSDTDERKEEVFAAFAAGKVRVLVTKPKIGGFGLNWQHCGHQSFFPSHSFEQWYQCVRRSWRFGRTEPVKIDIVSTDGAAAVMASLKAKAISAERMFEQLVGLMNEAQHIGRTGYGDTNTEKPLWL